MGLSGFFEGIALSTFLGQRRDSAGLLTLGSRWIGILLLAGLLPLCARGGADESQKELSNADIVSQCRELGLSGSAYPACERAAAEELIKKTQTLQQPTCGADFYPPEALKMNEGGEVVVRVCVGINNLVDGPVEVIKSSGVRSLDRAATSCVAAGKFKAGTKDGVPVRACKDMKITFSPPSTVRAAADELFKAYDALALRPDDAESHNERDELNATLSGLCPLLADDNKYIRRCMGLSADYAKHLASTGIAGETDQATVHAAMATPVHTVEQANCGEDFYPKHVLKHNEGGSSVVRFCVGADNRILDPMELIQSSGVPALDEAAGKCVAASKFKAATINGVPVWACKELRVTFMPLH